MWKAPSRSARRSHPPKLDVASAHLRRTGTRTSIRSRPTLHPRWFRPKQVTAASESQSVVAIEGAKCLFQKPLRARVIGALNYEMSSSECQLLGRTAPAGCVRKGTFSETRNSLG